MTSKTPNSKWLTIALIVSLVINLVLVGFVAGRMSQGGPVARTTDPTLAFPRFAKELSEARRKEMRPQLREHLAAVRANRGQLREARRALNKAITAEPFEPEQMRAALAHMDAVQNRVSESAQNSFVQFIESLTPSERAKFVERHQHAKRRHKKHN